MSEKENRRKELITKIEDAIYDCKMRAMWKKEFVDPTKELIAELKALEEELGVKDPRWKKFSKELE